MLSVNVTVNYPQDEKNYDLPFNPSNISIGDVVKDIINTEKEATSFIFVVSVRKLP